MNEKVECFVLSQTDYGENSLLVNVLTIEFGKLTFVASGVKKTTSKNASGILLYTKSEFTFDYVENKTMFRLKSAKTKDYYRNLHEDIEYIAASALISEASDHLLLTDGDLELQQSIYLLLEEAYSYLNEKRNSKLIVALYLAKLLQIFGTSMEVDECVLCGKKKVSSFSVEDGGYLCADCANKKHIRFLEPSILIAIRHINKASFQHLDILEKDISSKDIPIDLFISFYETHIGSNLKSYSFYKRFIHDAQ